MPRARVFPITDRSRAARIMMTATTAIISMSVKPVRILLRRLVFTY
jgi:hypothetical protein